MEGRQYQECENLREITVPLKHLVALLALLVDVHGGSVLLASSHGPLGTLVGTPQAQGPLERRNGSGTVGLPGPQGSRLVALVNNKLGRMSGLGQTTFQRESRGVPRGVPRRLVTDHLVPSDFINEIGEVTTAVGLVSRHVLVSWTEMGHGRTQTLHGQITE